MGRVTIEDLREQNEKLTRIVKRLDQENERLLSKAEERIRERIVNELQEDRDEIAEDLREIRSEMSTGKNKLKTAVSKMSEANRSLNSAKAAVEDQTALQTATAILSALVAVPVTLQIQKWGIEPAWTAVAVLGLLAVIWAIRRVRGAITSEST
jgi:chromosome segregation ATPase